MNLEKATKKDLYYTKDHEWIDFQGTIAYVGVCNFKLIGFKEIHGLTFRKNAGFLREGEVIATISYHDYRVHVHMPVDGKLQQVNETLISGNKNGLLRQSEGAAWIAQVIPAMPYERRGLLLPKEYPTKW